MKYIIILIFISINIMDLNISADYTTIGSSRNADKQLMNIGAQNNEYRNN